MHASTTTPHRGRSDLTTHLNSTPIDRIRQESTPSCSKPPSKSGRSFSFRNSIGTLLDRINSSFSRPKIEEIPKAYGLPGRLIPGTHELEVRLEASPGPAELEDTHWPRPVELYTREANVEHSRDYLSMDTKHQHSRLHSDQRANEHLPSPGEPYRTSPSTCVPGNIHSTGTLETASLPRYSTGSQPPISPYQEFHSHGHTTGDARQGSGQYSDISPIHIPSQGFGRRSREYVLYEAQYSPTAGPSSANTVVSGDASLRTYGIATGSAPVHHPESQTAIGSPTGARSYYRDQIMQISNPLAHSPPGENNGVAPLAPTIFHFEPHRHDHTTTGVPDPWQAGDCFPGQDSSGYPPATQYNYYPNEPPPPYRNIEPTRPFNPPASPFVGQNSGMQAISSEYNELERSRAPPRVRRVSGSMPVTRVFRQLMVGDAISCDDCGELFTGLYKRGNLRRHQTTQHGAPTNFPCELCPRTYKRADALRKHRWKKHRAGVPPRRRQTASAIDSVNNNTANLVDRSF